MGEKTVADVPKKNGDGQDQGKKLIPKRHEYTASIYPGPDRKINPKFGELCHKVEQAVNKPLWLLIHPGLLDDLIFEKFFEQRDSFVAAEDIALIIHSPGGLAASAFRLADFLRKRCGGFTAIVPYYAKSAATLLAIGSDKLIMGKYAELGPLDAQIQDPDKEEIGSALNEVQSLERLHEIALQEIDSTTLFLLQRTGKKIDTILPLVTRFVAEMKKPLLDRIETVHYTSMSRLLKQIQEYALRLLQPKYRPEAAAAIAQGLVHGYPDHSFIIDHNEAIDRLGLNVELASDPLEELFFGMRKYLKSDKLDIIGKLALKDDGNGKDN